MELFDFIVKRDSGKISKLDKDYKELILDIVSMSDDERSCRWETYNLIIKEFFDIDDCKYFKEIKYRVTDGEDPNLVMLDIISRYDSGELSALIWFLKRRIEEYVEDDFFRGFYK